MIETGDLVRFKKSSNGVEPFHVVNIFAEYGGERIVHTDSSDRPSCGLSMLEIVKACAVETDFKIGDKVSFINGSRWNDYKVVTIATIDGDENHAWATVEESTGTAALYSLELHKPPAKATVSSWTDEEAAELDACILRVKALEAKQVLSQHIKDGDNVRSFFTDLQKLLKSHSVAVFARNCEAKHGVPSPYSEVWFQFLKSDAKGPHFKVNTKRSHSTSEEFDWMCISEEF